MCPKTRYLDLFHPFFLSFAVEELLTVTEVAGRISLAPEVTCSLDPRSQGVHRRPTQLCLRHIDRDCGTSDSGIVMNAGLNHYGNQYTCGTVGRLD